MPFQTYTLKTLHVYYSLVPLVTVVSDDLTAVVAQPTGITTVELVNLLTLTTMMVPFAGRMSPEIMADTHEISWKCVFDYQSS